MSETYTAVLDRIVDGETAVLLLEDDGAVIDERTLAIDRLPDEGRHEGAVFDVELEGGDDEDDDSTGESPLTITYRPSTERKRREAMEDRFDRLSERLPDDERSNE